MLLDFPISRTLVKIDKMAQPQDGTNSKNYLQVDQQALAEQVSRRD